MGAKVSSSPTTPLMSGIAFHSCSYFHIDFLVRYHHIIVAEDAQKQDLVEFSQPRSVGARKESAGAGDLRQSLEFASQAEESIGDVTIGPVRMFSQYLFKHLCRKPMTSL